MKSELTEFHAIKEELQRWYNKDKTVAVQQELATLAAGAGRVDMGLTAQADR
jgi:hypothetical protein